MARSTRAQPLWMRLIVYCAMLMASSGVAHDNSARHNRPIRWAPTRGSTQPNASSVRLLPMLTSRRLGSNARLSGRRARVRCARWDPEITTCDMENMGRLPPGTEQEFMRGFRDGFDLGSIGAIR